MLTHCFIHLLSCLIPRSVIVNISLLGSIFVSQGQYWSIRVDIVQIDNGQSVKSQSVNSQSINTQSVSQLSVSQSIVSQLVSHCQYQERDGCWLINNLIAILYKIISFGYIGGPKKGHLVHYNSSHFCIHYYHKGLENGSLTT